MDKNLEIRESSSEVAQDDNSLNTIKQFQVKLNPKNIDDIFGFGTSDTIDVRYNWQTHGQDRIQFRYHNSDVTGHTSDGTMYTDEETSASQFQPFFTSRYYQALAQVQETRNIGQNESTNYSLDASPMPIFGIKLKTYDPDDADSKYDFSYTHVTAPVKRANSTNSFSLNIEEQTGIEELKISLKNSRSGNTSALRIAIKNPATLSRFYDSDVSVDTYYKNQNLSSIFNDITTSNFGNFKNKSAYAAAKLNNIQASSAQSQIVEVEIPSKYVKDEADALPVAANLNLVVGQTVPLKGQVFELNDGGSGVQPSMYCILSNPVLFKDGTKHKMRIHVLNNVHANDINTQGIYQDIVTSIPTSKKGRLVQFGLFDANGAPENLNISYVSRIGCAWYVNVKKPANAGRLALKYKNSDLANDANVTNEDIEVDGPVPSGYNVDDEFHVGENNSMSGKVEDVDTANLAPTGADALNRYTVDATGPVDPVSGLTVITVMYRAPWTNGKLYPVKIKDTLVLNSGVNFAGISSADPGTSTGTPGHIEKIIYHVEEIAPSKVNPDKWYVSSRFLWLNEWNDNFGEASAGPVASLQDRLGNVSLTDALESYTWEVAGGGAGDERYHYSVPLNYNADSVDQDDRSLWALEPSILTSGVEGLTAGAVAGNLLSNDSAKAFDKMFKRPTNFYQDSDGVHHALTNGKVTISSETNVTKAQVGQLVVGGVNRENAPEVWPPMLGSVLYSSWIDKHVAARDLGDDGNQASAWQEPTEGAGSSGAFPLVSSVVMDQHIQSDGNSTCLVFSQWVSEMDPTNKGLGTTALNDLLGDKVFNGTSLSSTTVTDNLVKEQVNMAKLALFGGVAANNSYKYARCAVVLADSRLVMVSPAVVGGLAKGPYALDSEAKLQSAPKGSVAAVAGSPFLNTFVESDVRQDPPAGAAVQSITHVNGVKKLLSRTAEITLNKLYNAPSSSISWADRYGYNSGSGGYTLKLLQYTRFADYGGGTSHQTSRNKYAISSSKQDGSLVSISASTSMQDGINNPERLGYTQDKLIQDYYAYNNCRDETDYTYGAGGKLMFDAKHNDDEYVKKTTALTTVFDAAGGYGQLWESCTKQRRAEVQYLAHCVEDTREMFMMLKRNGQSASLVADVGEGANTSKLNYATKYHYHVQSTNYLTNNNWESANQKLIGSVKSNGLIDRALYGDKNNNMMYGFDESLYPVMPSHVSSGPYRLGMTDSGKEDKANSNCPFFFQHIATNERGERPGQITTDPYGGDSVIQIINVNNVYAAENIQDAALAKIEPNSYVLQGEFAGTFDANGVRTSGFTELGSRNTPGDGSHFLRQHFEKTAGSGATFKVDETSGQIEIDQAGQNYKCADVLYLGKSDSTNDLLKNLVVTVKEIDGNGGVVDFILDGKRNGPGDLTFGTGLKIDLSGSADGSVTQVSGITAAGVNYKVGDKIALGPVSDGTAKGIDFKGNDEQCIYINAVNSSGGVTGAELRNEKAGAAQGDVSFTTYSGDSVVGPILNEPMVYLASMFKAQQIEVSKAKISRDANCIDENDLIVGGGRGRILKVIPNGNLAAQYSAEPLVDEALEKARIEDNIEALKQGFTLHVEIDSDPNDLKTRQIHGRAVSLPMNSFLSFYRDADANDDYFLTNACKNIGFESGNMMLPIFIQSPEEYQELISDECQVDEVDGGVGTNKYVEILLGPRLPASLPDDSSTGNNQIVSGEVAIRYDAMKFNNNFKLNESVSAFGRSDATAKIYLRNSIMPLHTAGMLKTESEILKEKVMLL